MEHKECGTGQNSNATKPMGSKKRIGLYITLLLVVAGIGMAVFLMTKSGNETTKNTLAGPDEATETVETEADGEVQTFIISPDSNVVKTDDFRIKMPATCLNGDEQLTVQRVAPRMEMPMDAGHHVVLSVNLGNKHDLEGVAEIKIPFKKQMAGTKVCAGYLNPETKEWEPVDWTYRNGVAVILTDHLSDFGVFEVAEEMTSRMHFTAMLDPFDIREQAEEDLGEVVELFESLINSDSEEAETLDRAADVYGKFSQFGMDMSYNVIKALGYENAFLEDFGDEMGWLGVFFSTWQIARYAHESKDKEVAGNTIKTIVNFWEGKALGAIGGAVGHGCLAGIAVFDYVLNEFLTQVVANRLAQYKKAYLAYYKDNKWNEFTWYRKLWPIMSNTKLSSEQVHEAVEELVTKRVYEFWEDWDDPDKSHLTDYYTDGATTFDGKHSTGTGLGGGLDDKMMAEISEWYRAHLHQTVISNVMTEIAGKLRAINFKRYKEALLTQARLLNKWLEFRIIDTDMQKGSQSSLMGYSVRFRDLPKRVSDKEKWETMIDEKGRGRIKIVNYAYIYQNMKPVVQLVSPEGKVVREIEYTVGVPVTEIRVSLKEPDRIPDWVMGTWESGNLGKYDYHLEGRYEEFVISPTHLSFSVIDPDNQRRTFVDCDYELKKSKHHVYDYNDTYDDTYTLRLYNTNDPELEGGEGRLVINYRKQMRFDAYYGENGYSHGNLTDMEKVK